MGGCSSLEEVVLPPSITHIGANFIRGGGLKRLDLSGLAGLETIPSDFLTGVEEVVLPLSITTIEAGAFSECSTLKWLDMGLLSGLTRPMSSRLREVQFSKQLSLKIFAAGGNNTSSSAVHPDRNLKGSEVRPFSPLMSSRLREVQFWKGKSLMVSTQCGSNTSSSAVHPDKNLLGREVRPFSALMSIRLREVQPSRKPC